MIAANEPASGRRWSGWQAGFLLLGLALLVALVARVGWRNLLAQALGIGWYFAAVVVLFGGVHFLRALSWRLCLGEEGRRVTLGSLWGLWLAGEAVSHLSFWWSGEAFRALTTRPAVSVERAVSAQLLLRVIYAYASLWWVVASFLLLWWAVRLEGAVESVMVVATLVSVALLLLATAALVAHERMIAPLANWLERRSGQRLWERLLSFLRVLESDLRALVGDDTGRRLRLLGWNLLAALAGVAEVYLILHGLGATPTLPQAFVVESLNKALGVFGYLVPGNVGVREAGTMLAVELFGFTAVTGLNLALIRRARILVWVAIGALWLVRQAGTARGFLEPAAKELPADKLAGKVTSPR